MSNEHGQRRLNGIERASVGLAQSLGQSRDGINGARHNRRRKRKSGKRSRRHDAARVSVGDFRRLLQLGDLHLEGSNLFRAQAQNHVLVSHSRCRPVFGSRLFLPRRDQLSLETTRLLLPFEKPILDELTTAQTKTTSNISDGRRRERSSARGRPASLCSLLSARGCSCALRPP